MTNILIIGYGNPLRSDDGFGWRAAEALECLLTDENVQVLACHQLTPELAIKVSAADLVIFLDASVEELPGSLACRCVRTTRLLPMGYTHHVSPETLLALAGECFGAEPRALLFTVGVKTMELGEELSPPVQAAMIDLVAQIQDWFLPQRVM